MKKILLIMLVTSIFIRCQENTLVDEVFDETTSGSVLRTLNSKLNLLDISDDQSAVTIDLQQQDASFGTNFESLNVYVGFIYKDTLRGKNIAGDDIKSLKTINASEFTIGSKGLPEYQFNATLAELFAPLSSDVEGNRYLLDDIITITFGVVMNDGTEWTDGNGNANITGGAYFSSPYIYNAPIGDLKRLTVNEISVVESLLMQDSIDTVSILFNPYVGDANLVDSLSDFVTLPTLTAISAIGETPVELGPIEAIYNKENKFVKFFVQYVGSAVDMDTISIVISDGEFVHWFYNEK